MRVDATRVGDYHRIRVRPVTGTIGAEVDEVDLRDLDDETVAELHDAWMQHKVLFFHGQELSRSDHVEYVRNFGELEVHPFAPHVDGHPEMLVLNSTPESFQAAETWHSDVTFRECPPTGSVLRGRVVPEWGGDTCFANMELAYELLTDEVKAEIEGAYAVHSYMKAFGRSMSEEKRAEAQQQFPDQKHPVVRTHPVTGAKALFVNQIFTLRIDGIDPQRSRSLLWDLYAQAKLPEVQCRFRWREGSIAQWDNRCTQHYAVPDHGGTHRRMERVTLVGDEPI